MVFLRRVSVLLSCSVACCWLNLGLAAKAAATTPAERVQIRAAEGALRKAASSVRAKKYSEAAQAL